MTVDSARSFRRRLTQRPNLSSRLPSIHRVIRFTCGTLVRRNWSTPDPVVRGEGNASNHCSPSPTWCSIAFYTYAASWLPALTGTLPAGEGVAIYRRSKPASFVLSMRSLSQAPRIGGLRPPHGYLSGPAISPPACIHRQLRPWTQGLACTSPGGTGFRRSLIPLSRFVTHPLHRLLRHAPTSPDLRLGRDR